MGFKRRRSTERMHDLRPALAQRCQGECERCGRPLARAAWGVVFDAHHRQRRSQGGPDSLSNTVAVHHLCHVLNPESLHQSVAQAAADGFIVHADDIPATVPLLYKGRWSWLDDDGTVRPVPDAPLPEGADW